MIDQAALSGVRVLDLSRVLAGPWATQILADFGAEVIKIERPHIGDDTRRFGPPYIKDAAGNDLSDAAYYASANRNKHSVALDFGTEDGRAILLQLLDQCDILVENFKVGTLQKYGLDYATLRQTHPRLIYCSITGFGQTGPYASHPGYDYIIQAMGGLMSITGTAEGEPMRVGVAVVDVMTGLYSTIGILTALRVRDQTGQGQHIDVGLLDVSIAALANQAMNYLTTGQPPQRIGNSHPNIVPYQLFPAADGQLIIAVGNDGQYQRLCAVLGAMALATDERFATMGARVENRAQLIPLLAAITVTRPIQAWISALQAVGVPCGPINDLAAVFDDPHVVARAVRRDLPHPTAGHVPTVANPIHLSATPAHYQHAPPLLGQHTAAVLTDLLCMDEATIATLCQANIIQTA